MSKVLSLDLRVRVLEAVAERLLRSDAAEQDRVFSLPPRSYLPIGQGGKV